jgi:hypothetical protein
MAMGWSWRFFWRQQGQSAMAVLLGTDRPIAKTALAMVTGALLGFFYVGTAMAQNPQAAIIGAMVGGGLGAIASRFCRSPLWLVALLTVGSLATYGFTFLAGVNGLNHLSVGHAWRGGLWVLMAGLYLGLTLRAVTQLCQTISTSAKTRFMGADLTGADLPIDLSPAAIARYGIQRQRAV